MVVRNEEICRRFRQELWPVPAAEREPRICGPTWWSEGANSPFSSDFSRHFWSIVTTPRGNNYLLTFIDHCTKYVEAFPIHDQMAETCGSVYANQIVTRHGTGSQLITDQGRPFMSSFFQETVRSRGYELRAPLVTTLSQMAPLKGGIAHFTRVLSHYINSASNNCVTLIPFYLMGYRATPNSVTGHSHFFLLHGREMEIPTTINWSVEFLVKKLS